MAKVSFMFPISEAQKADMEKWGAEHDLSSASVIRLALANLTGYDLASEPPTQRKRKWASPQERTLYERAMRKATQKRQRDVMRLLASGNTAEAQALAAQPIEPADYTPQCSTVKVGIPSLATPPDLEVAEDEDEDE